MKTLLKKYKILHILSIVLISILCCLNIQKLNYIAVLNDEFGYWGNAVSIVGYNWKSLIAETPFYSLGYSLLLVPIIMLFPTPEIWYKAAILLNVGLLIASYFLLYYIGRKIFPNVSREVTIYVSLLTVIFPSNITYAQIAWSETLLYFLTIAITVCIVKLVEKFSYKWLILMAFLMLYSYLTHARCIGTIVAGSIIIVLILIKHNKKVHALILPIVLLIIGYLGIQFIVDFQLTNLWGNSEISNMNVLNVSSDVIDGYFTRFLQNIRLFLESLGGKFLYLNIGTGFIFLYTTLNIIKNIILNIKERRIGTDSDILFYWGGLLSWIMLALSALQMMNWSDRKDIIVYSRYMEHVLAPVIFGGIMLVCTQKKIIRTNALLSMILVALGLRSIYYRVIEANSFFNSICSPIIGAFYDNFDEIETTFIVISILCVIYMIVFLIISFMKDYSKKIMFLSTFFCVWVIIGVAANTYMNDARKYFEMNTIQIKNKLESFNGLNIYYLKDVEHDLYSANPKYLQYEIPRKTIQVINEKELKKLDEECLILSNPEDDRLNEYNNNGFMCSYIDSSDMLSLFIMEEQDAK